MVCCHQTSFERKGVRILFLFILSGVGEMELFFFPKRGDRYFFRGPSFAYPSPLSDLKLFIYIIIRMTDIASPKQHIRFLASFENDTCVKIPKLQLDLIRRGISLLPPSPPTSPASYLSLKEPPSSCCLHFGSRNACLLEMAPYVGGTLPLSLEYMVNGVFI